MEAIKWENGFMEIPVSSEMIPALDQAGAEGWEPWAIIGLNNNTVRIAIKRPKRLLTLATEMPK
jgi:hypothetical protein